MSITRGVNEKAISTDHCMEAQDQLWLFFRNLSQQLPSLLTLVGCIIFAITRWSRYPKVSLFAVLSLLFLLIHGIVFTAVYVWLPDWLDRSNSSSFQTVMMIVRLIYNATLAFGLGLLLAAIFMRRSPPAVA